MFCVWSLCLKSIITKFWLRVVSRNGQASANAREFWGQLEASNLLLIGYTSLEIPHVVAELIKVKLTAVLKDPDFDSAESLSVIFRSSPSALPEQLRKEVDIINIIVCPESASADNIEHALEFIKGDKLEFLCTMKDWNDGKAILLKADQVRLSKVAATQDVEDLRNLIKGVQESSTDGFFNGELEHAYLALDNKVTNFSERSFEFASTEGIIVDVESLHDSVAGAVTAKFAEFFGVAFFNDAAVDAQLWKQQEHEATRKALSGLLSCLSDAKGPALQGPYVGHLGHAKSLLDGLPEMFELDVPSAKVTRIVAVKKLASQSLHVDDAWLSFCEDMCGEVFGTAFIDFAKRLKAKHMQPMVDVCLEHMRGSFKDTRNNYLSCSLYPPVLESSLVKLVFRQVGL